MIWAALLPVLLAAAIFVATLLLGGRPRPETPPMGTTVPGADAEMTRPLRRRADD